LLPFVTELRLFNLLFDKAQLLRIFHVFPALKVLQLKDVWFRRKEVEDADTVHGHDAEEAGDDLPLSTLALMS